MPILFQCKTGEAFVIKVLAELLASNLMTGPFEVSERGIFLRTPDLPRKILVDLELFAENFCPYIFDSKEKLGLGLNLRLFHKLLKSIKKKDTVNLYIDDAVPNDLKIEVAPDKNGCITTSGIRIQNVQNLELDVPNGYGKPIIVNSAQFQKGCKDLSNIGTSNVKIYICGYIVQFVADADSIMTRTVDLGDKSTQLDPNAVPIFEGTFPADQLQRITKIAGLNNSQSNATMQIFPGYGKLPILFRSNVGNLGRVSIYIKSKEFIEKEENTIEPDDNDSESD